MIFNEFFEDKASPVFSFALLFAFVQTNGHPKPNPRPRCVVKANTASPPPASVNKPEVGRLQTGSANKPQIVPRVSSSSSSFNTNNQSFQRPTTTITTTTNQNNFVKPPEVKPKPQNNSLKPEPEVKNTTNNGYNNNINQNKTKDCVDEGLAMLRRQPSIKDRKRVCTIFSRFFKKYINLIFGIVIFSSLDHTFPVYLLF